MPVQVNVVTWDQYGILLEAGATGGEMAGVVWMHVNEAEKYMENGIPRDHDVNVLLYNKGVFDQYGVDYPDETWTWDTFAQMERPRERLYRMRICVLLRCRNGRDVVH